MCSYISSSVSFFHVSCFSDLNWLLCHLIWFMQHFCHRRVIMVAADNLVPVWHQGMPSATMLTSASSPISGALQSNGTWVALSTYCQISNISHTLVSDKFVGHSDVVGAPPVGAAPTTSSFSTSTRGFNWLGKHNCKMRWETFKFWNLECLTLEIWW